jgi:hypothetical protein
MILQYFLLSIKQTKSMNSIYRGVIGPVWISFGESSVQPNELSIGSIFGVFQK